MAGEIKVEVTQISAQTLCHGCLCQDRKLKPLSGEIYKLYYSLLGSGMLYGSEERMICWECEATLRRVRRFQNQIIRAQSELLELFYNMSPKLERLTNLSIIKKDHYDMYYDSNPPPELSITKNCTVKIEKFKEEPSTSQHSDYEDNFFDDSSKNFEIKNESGKEENKDTNVKKEPMTKKEYKRQKALLLRMQKQKYLKYTTVRDLKAKFGSVESYFVEEFLDYQQVEECIVKENKTHLTFRRCCKCKLNFRDKNLLLLHQNLVHFEPDRSLTCLMCKKELANFEDLRNHCKYTHCGFFKCTLCNTYCRKAGRIKHLKTQHTKVYTCKKCSGEFRTERLFTDHYKALHDTFICHHCNRACKDKSTLIDHLLVHADQHPCTICNKNYEKRSFLMRHINQYHPELKNKKDDKEAAYCVECNIQFKTVPVYRKHLTDSAKHNKKVKQSVPCPVCGQIFSMKKYMKNHLYQKHMTEKAKWKCTICDRLFANNWGLKGHIKNVHLKVPKEKNEFCDICGRGFNLKQTLVKHRRIHTGERPYQCGYCSAAFTQRTPLVAHQRSHHHL